MQERRLFAERGKNGSIGDSAYAWEGELDVSVSSATGGGQANRGVVRIKFMPAFKPSSLCTHIAKGGEDRRRELILDTHLSVHNVLHVKARIDDV